MSASATAPYPCGEYPVDPLDLPATVKKELVAYRVARDRNKDAAVMKAIGRAFAAADAARCRTSLHFDAVLVEAGECARRGSGDAKGQLQYCTEALALLQTEPSLPPILRSVHSRALLCRCEALYCLGRQTEALADAQQAAALAVTPWDEVRAYSTLARLYTHVLDEHGQRLKHEAIVQLEAALAACEAEGVPSTDQVLQDGIEAVWVVKCETACLEHDHAAALVYVRKRRALAKQEGHMYRNNPLHMVGEEAVVLARLGRGSDGTACSSS